MSAKFSGVKARRYSFRDDVTGETRPVIALYAGPKLMGFVEFDGARRLVDQVHDLCDARDRELREAVQS